MSLFASILTAFVMAPCSGQIYVDEDCPRIRRPIHLLSDEELLLYVEGLHGLRANGKYQVFVDSHFFAATESTIHLGDASIFYHTYLIWEVETSVVCAFILHKNEINICFDPQSNPEFRR